MVEIIAQAHLVKVLAQSVATQVRSFPVVTAKMLQVLFKVYLGVYQRVMEDQHFSFFG